jgi:hypothetical protein
MNPHGYKDELTPAPSPSAKSGTVYNENAGHKNGNGLIKNDALDGVKNENGAILIGADRNESPEVDH